MDIWNQIKTRRLKSQLSQQEVAARARVSLATLQNIEAGRANPAHNTLLAICQVLGLQLSLLAESPKDHISLLISYGVPLMEGGKLMTARPNRTSEGLLKILNGITPLISDLKRNSREELALASFLRALRDHYPTFWTRTDRNLELWLVKRPISAKLRRLALASLSEYL